MTLDAAMNRLISRGLKVHKDSEFTLIGGTELRLPVGYSDEGVYVENYFRICSRNGLWFGELPFGQFMVVVSSSQDILTVVDAISTLFEINTNLPDNSMPVVQALLMLQWRGAKAEIIPNEGILATLTLNVEEAIEYYFVIKLENNQWACALFENEVQLLSVRHNALTEVVHSVVDRINELQNVRRIEK